MNALKPEIGTALKIGVINIKSVTIASSISTVVVSLQKTLVKTETAVIRPIKSAKTTGIGTVQDLRCVITVITNNLILNLTVSLFLFYRVISPLQSTKWDGLKLSDKEDLSRIAKVSEAAEIFMITFETKATRHPSIMNARIRVIGIIGTSTLIFSVLSFFSARIGRSSLKISMVTFNTEAVTFYSILNSLAAGISNL